MPFVLTVDQIRSRGCDDAVARAIQDLSRVSTLLPFVRTVGDEFQGLLGDPSSVVDAILLLMRNERWHVGVGIGPVDRPLPADSRSARGPAFLHARAAVAAAKADSSHLAVVTAGEGADAAYDVQAVWRLTSAVRSRRSVAGWEVVDLLEAGRTPSQIARRLEISRQAVAQRRQAAQWAAERAVRPTLVRLLARADETASA